MIISISGPCMTGKTTIINLLKDRLPKDTVYQEDLFKIVWEEFHSKGFEYFSEVAKDRDFTIMYISKLVESYVKMIKELDDSDKLIVLENCHLDYLIYAQLNSWYHYPLGAFLEDTISKLMSTARFTNRVYITTADDEGFPLTKSTIIECKTIKAYFKRNRKLEKQFYDIYRNFTNVVTLPSNPLECDTVILDDLKLLGII